MIYKKDRLTKLYYKKLKKLDNSDTPKKIKLFIKNYQYLNKKKYIKINKKHAKIITNYLEDNKDIVTLPSLKKTLEKHDLSYKNLRKTLDLLKLLITNKITNIIKVEENKYIKILEVEKSINTLLEEKDISLNKYYKLEADTEDYIYYHIYNKLVSLHNPKLFKSYILTLNLFNKDLDQIIKNVVNLDKETTKKLDELFISINNINNISYEDLYLLNKYEKLLIKDEIYKNMSSLTKNIYRKKILRHLNPTKYLEKRINKEKHIGFYLFKRSSLKFRLKYDNVIDESKTLIIINCNIKSLEEINKNIQKIIKNNQTNMIYYFKILPTSYEIENYYQNKVADINEKYNKTIFLENLNKKNVKENNVKYVVSLENIKNYDKEKIKTLIEIMSHPLNNPIYNKEETKIIKGYAMFKFNKFDEIYNYEAFTKINKRIKLRPSIIKNKLLNKKKINLKRIKRTKDKNKVKQNNKFDPNSLIVLTNNNYSLLINNKESSSRYKNLIINKEKTGNYFLIKDKDIVICNISEDTKSYDKFVPSYENNILTYNVEKNKLRITTEIKITLKNNIEIRKLSIKNISNKDKQLEISSYLELNENLIPKYKDNKIIIETNNLLINYKLIADSKISYNTNKLNFIRRHENIEKYEINNIDYQENIIPIVNFNTKMNLKTNETKEIYLITHIDSKENTDELDYQDLINKEENALNINNFDYNKLISDIKENIDNNYQNNDIKKYLEKFNINEKYPLIAIEIDNEYKIDFIKDIIKFEDYCKKINYYISIIFILTKNITDEKKEKIKYLISPSNIILTDTKNKNDILHIYLYSTYIISASKYNKIKDLSKILRGSKYQELKEVKIEKEIYQNGTFDNEYGMFINDGKEYLIKNIKTPMPWKNIFKNKDIEIEVSDNNNYTLYKNKELTKKNNNLFSNDYGEYFKINNELMLYSSIIHGLGYSYLITNTKEYKIITKITTALNDNIKITYMKIENKTDNNLTLDITYLFKLATDEKNINFYSDKNLITIEKDNKLFFISSNSRITKKDIDASPKEITTNINLPPKKEKEISFVMGIEKPEFVWFLNEKYRGLASIETSIKITEKNYLNTITKLNITTPDLSFNYLVNYWLLYETLINKDSLKENEYKNIFIPLKDLYITYLNKNQTITLKYIISLYEYIKKTEDFLNLDDKLMEKIKNYINKNIENSKIYYEALDSFIKLSKMYNKNIDTKKLQERLKNIKNILIKKENKTIIETSELLLIDIASTEDIANIEDSLNIKNYKDNEMLYLKVLYKLKKYDLLYQTYQELNPINKTSTKEKIDKYLYEPYFVKSNYTDLYYIATKYILGINIIKDRLYITPHLPQGIENFSITYRYINTTYNIDVKLDKKNKILVDDYYEEVDYIRLKNDFKVHNIVIRRKNK